MASNEQRILDTKRNELIQEIINSDLYGKNIYLLGSAEFGPTNEPILINSTVGLYNKFGKQGTLIDAFHCIKYVNKNNNVYLVKTTGEHSILYLNVNIYNGEIIRDALVIEASESNEIYNDIKVTIDIDNISFSFPKETKIEDKTYYYEDFPTIERLCSQINKETNLKKNKIKAYYEVDPATPTKDAFYCCNKTTNYLYGGYCGLNYNKDMLYKCLDRTYEMLESDDIDFIIPVDAFIDDIYPDDSEEQNNAYNLKYYHPIKDYLMPDTNGNYKSFLNQLLNFCIKQLNFGVITHGVIGYNNLYTNDYLYEADEVVEMLINCLEWNMKKLDDSFYSFLVTVTAGDLRYNHGTVISNSCYAFASFSSSIVVTDNVTNKQIDNISLYTEFSEDVLQTLEKNNITVFRQSPLYETPVIYNAVTLSKDKDLRYFVNTRMIQLAICYLNKLFKFYIGSSMQWLIEDGIIKNDSMTVLQSIKNRGIINDYKISFTPYYYENLIKTKLSIVTNYMTEEINIFGQIESQFEEY